MVTDDVFFAWLDGELDRSESGRVAAEVAASPELAKRAADHRAMQARLTKAFDGLLEAPVPEPLLQALRTPAPKVHDLAAARRSHQARRWALPQWAALAATLAIGILAGTMIPRESNAPVELRDSKVYAAAA